MNDDKSTQLMRFDEDSQRYYLTVKGYYFKTGTDLGKVLNTDGNDNATKLPQLWLDLICEKCYDFVEEHAQNDDVAVCAMNFAPSLKGKLFEVFVREVLYNLNNGNPSIYSGANFDNATIMDLDSVRGEIEVSSRFWSFCTKRVDELCFGLFYQPQLTICQKERIIRALKEKGNTDDVSSDDKS